MGVDGFEPPTELDWFGKFTNCCFSVVYNDFNFPAVGMVTDFFARDITKLYNTQVQTPITKHCESVWLLLLG